MRRLRILTWHVHGNYLYYLSSIPHDIYIPVRDDGTPGYGGRGLSFPFGDNVREISASDVSNADFDCVLYQSRQNYQVDRFEILSEQQRQLPSIYLEHDPPQEHPTNTIHPASGNTTVVHVTHFNALMWDNQGVRTRVIEHGVHIDPAIEYSGRKEAGVVVINNLGRRGRRLGLDIYEDLRHRVPLDLVGMGSEELGGLGEVPPMKLPATVAGYRFFFHPVRYTSCGLAVIEAMLAGVPVVGLATTEMPTMFQDGVNGFISTDPQQLEQSARRLLDDPELARRVGGAGRETARRRFGMERFVRDWNDTLNAVCVVGTDTGRETEK